MNASKAGERTQTVYKKTSDKKAGYIFTETKSNVEMQATDENGSLVLYQRISFLCAAQIKSVLHREGYLAIAILT